MSRILKSLLGVFVSLIIASVVQAQQADVSSQSSASNTFPRLVRFSGTLPERRGASPATAAAAARVTFAVYEEQAGGAALWSEVQDVRHDAQGRYSVLLGAASSDGLPAELFSTAGARWLGVQVEGRSEEARILLVAVPYALKAADADTLGGKPATAFVASDQLKDQVQSVVQAQTAQAGAAQGTRTLVGTSPTPQVIAETSPATFTCATSGVCVQSTQSGAGGIALRAATGSATGTGAIFDNLGGGKILSGRTTGYAEKFYVDGGGNVWAGGALLANAYAATSGAAVFGVATAGSGTAYGVRGQSASPSGVGAFGYATSATGATYGVLGSNLSTSGTGLSGSASSLTGNTIGVRAVVQSPNGTAAIFDNLGGGKLISARTTGYVEKFSVASNGNIVTSGALSANGVIEAGGYLSTAEFIGIPATANDAVGVIRMGGGSFIHACCNASNFFAGIGAGNFTLNGSASVGIGTDALQSDTTGTGNTAVGYTALQTNTIGGGNTAVGTGALNVNLDSHYSSALGYWALRDSNASFNTAVGSHALQSNTTGGNNVAIGAEAGLTATPANANTTGGNNTFIGSYSGPGTSTQLNNAAAFGSNALVSASNSLVLGGTGGNAVNVGIGVEAPTALLHLHGQNNITMRMANTDINQVNSGTIDFLEGESTFGTDAFGFRVTFDGDANLFKIQSDNGGATVTDVIAMYRSGGNVGIGTIVPLNKLHVAGDIRVGTGSTGCVMDADATVIAGVCSSDLRLKSNVLPFPAVLSKLALLTPVTFDWRAAEFPERHFGARRSFGLIAQEVEKVFPDMVIRDAEGFRAVKYHQLPFLMLQGIRELKTENDELKQRVGVQQAENENLKAEVGKLSEQLSAFAERLSELERARE